MVLRKSSGEGNFIDKDVGNDGKFLNCKKVMRVRGKWCLGWRREA